MIAKLKQLARNKGYLIFTEPLKLNIWGFRSPSITPGKFADFIIMDKDIMTVAEDEIPNLKVRATYVNGEKVYAQE